MSDVDDMQRAISAFIFIITDMKFAQTKGFESSC